MNKFLKVLLLFTITFLILSCKNEKKAEPIEKDTDLPPLFEMMKLEFIIDNQEIWLANRDGNIRKFKLDNLDTIKYKFNSIHYFKLLVKDRTGNIVASDSSNQILVFDREKNEWNPIYKSKYKVLGITFDCKNSCYLITSQGIIETKNSKRFQPQKFANLFGDEKKGWTTKPCYTTDIKDRIWFGFNYGEFGGELYVFDLQSKKYLYPKRDHYYEPVTSIISFDNKVYMSTGFLHEGWKRGRIAEFDDLKCKFIFESGFDKKTRFEGEVIGDICFDLTENCLYLYSQNGIFKCNLDNNLSSIEKWSKVIQPLKQDLIRKFQSKIFVCRLEVINSHKFVFTTCVDQIGLYNGDGKLIMRK